ncbi:MAG: polyprenyl synthetase family protein [Actinomycetales bacterium]
MSLSDLLLRNGRARPGAGDAPDAAMEGYLGQVEEVLEDFFVASSTRGRDLTPRFAGLWDALRTTTAGGKRLRPRLVFTAWHGLGGADSTAAARVGAAFEVLHTALIVHDDVVDRDFTRRGKPNVSGLYLGQALAAGLPRPEAEHRAMSVGVVAGDVALLNAYRLLDRTDVAASVRSTLLDLLDEAVHASAAGELLDIEYSISAAGLQAQDVISMERLKTSVYSFEAPLKAGAVLAGADADIIAGLGDVGRNMGIAYQIVDDLLGVFGDEAGTGKSTLGDVREGKLTVLMSHASTRPQWPAIATHLGDPDLSEEQADQVRALLTEAGSRAYAEQLALSYAECAQERLLGADIPRTLSHGLERMLSAVLDRRR